MLLDPCTSGCAVRFQTASWTGVSLQVTPRLVKIYFGYIYLDRGDVAVIAEILPPTVVVEALREDPAVVALFPQEHALLGRAVSKRRREFATARLCAHRALEQLGMTRQPIPAGAGGEPLWPPGVLGSITHCAGYRACALARTADILALGIDAEPDRPLPDGVLAQVSLPRERQRLRALALTAGQVHCWDRLLFSAKEAIYKAWHPIVKRRLDFADAEVSIDAGTSTSSAAAARGTFSASLSPPGLPLAEGSLTTLHGHWLARDGLLFTAVALTSPRARSAVTENPV